MSDFDTVRNALQERRGIGERYSGKEALSRIEQRQADLLAALEGIEWIATSQRMSDETVAEWAARMQSAVVDAVRSFRAAIASAHQGEDSDLTGYLDGRPLYDSDDPGPAHQGEGT